MKRILISLLSLVLALNISQAAKKEKVEFKHLEQQKKVEVYVAGKLFTAYIYPDNMEKQSLYPIASASGKLITRGYPLDPRPFERIDHPHHVGLWFNFGSVNGLDFWNNSFAIKAEDKPKYGTVRFREIISQNPSKGTLVTASDWVDINDKVLLSEETTFVFEGTGNLRSIERTSKLTARQKVTFEENKEGLIGLRVDKAFEEPSQKAEEYLDAQGNLTTVPVMNTEGVNGVYRNAEGYKGGDVWSKRSPWVALRALKEGEVITIVILDHAQNPNYPAWSHARGYGLFATNNLGGKAFDKNATPVKIVLTEGQSLLFKHKILIGGDLTDAEINQIAKGFK
ncbi:MAG TPA: PmoA family protein [Prolixibacteraceae bacterium]|nr:PmoA family protein [Prolixibacteraceae bacterium]